jgi:hypothetical protein
LNETNGGISIPAFVFLKNFQKLFRNFLKRFLRNPRKTAKFQKSFLGNAKKRGVKRMVWYASDSMW